MNKFLVGFALLSMNVEYATHLNEEKKEDANLVLEVIRLKPDEERFLELALPLSDFRSAAKSGRSDFSVELYPEEVGGEFTRVLPGEAIKEESFNAAPYTIAEGVTLKWSNDKQGIEIAVSSSAPTVTKDIRVKYSNFGARSPSMIGFRVIVLSE